MLVPIFDILSITTKRDVIARIANFVHFTARLIRRLLLHIGNSWETFIVACFWRRVITGVGLMVVSGF